MLALNQKQVTLKLKEHLENTTNTLESLQPGTYKDHGPYLANKNVWEMSEVAVKGNDSGGTVDGGAGWGSCKDKTQRICVCVFVELSRGGRGCESTSKTLGLNSTTEAFWFRQPKQSRALRTAIGPRQDRRFTCICSSTALYPALYITLFPSVCLSLQLLDWVNSHRICSDLKMWVSPMSFVCVTVPWLSQSDFKVSFFLANTMAQSERAVWTCSYPRVYMYVPVCWDMKEICTAN